jgi:predicted RNase H-like nuclease (RuvC/YqgF family)
MTQDKTPISPVEQLKKDLTATQKEVNDLQTKVNLSTLFDKLEDIQTKVNGLQMRITDLRQRNYIFDTTLEENAQNLAKRWQPIHANTKVRLNQELIHLKAEIKPIEQQLVRASTFPNNITFSRQILNPLKTSIENLTKKVSASERLIGGMYDSFARELNIFTKNLENIEWTVKEFESSNVKLLLHEFLIMGVKAVWTKDGNEDKDDPTGVLYLTDQRLLFEQKEEVATKKFLFITKERELVQEVLIDIPLQLMETVQTTKQGIFKNKDFLDLTFSSGAQYNSAQFHIYNQDCEEWKGLINRVLSGDFDKNRTEPVEQEVIDKIKNAPTICPQCGATITVPILRGMQQFTCEFCGCIIKL